MKADFHMHTAFSSDASVPAEEMIRGAIEKGLQTICITDHMDKDYSEDVTRFTFDTDEYFKVLRPLQKKYREQIDVRIGVELGLQPHLGAFAHEYVNKYPFDFVIGSVHVIKGEDPYCGEMFQRYGDAEVYRQAFVETLENIRNISDFDVLGHLDYVVRYGKYQTKEYSYAAYADEIDEILKYLIENGKGIELNTAGLKYGLGFAHPHADVLKRYRELGGEIITVGADGHKPEHIAYDFSKVNQILTGCGFKYYTEFRERKPMFKQIG